MSAYMGQSQLRYGGGGDGPMSMTEEKLALQNVNDRFAEYICKVRYMRREQSNHVDSTGIMTSVKILEDELIVLKKMYEQEMETLRNKIETLSRENNKHQLSSQKNASLASELEAKLNENIEELREAQENYSKCKRLNREKDLEIQNAYALAEEPRHALTQLEREHDSLQRDIADITRKYEREKIARQEADDNLDVIRQKLNFQLGLFSEERSDFKDRLESANQQVLCQESKIRQLGESDNSLVDKLRRVREAAAQDLKKYQDESEARFKDALDQLKAQMAIDAYNISELSEDNKKLGNVIKDLEKQINELQIQLEAERSNGKLQVNNFDMERKQSLVHIHGMEQKLHELQDILVLKIGELTSTQAANVPLKAEIEALRAMLDDEEKKLSSAIESGKSGLQSAGPSLPPAPISTYRSKTSYNIKTGGCGVGIGDSYGKTPMYNITGLSTSLTKDGPEPRPITVPPTIGSGKDYFETMFQGKQQSINNQPKKFTTTSHDYNTRTSSATGTLKIYEVEKEGQYIRLFNSSSNHDCEIGGYLIQQNVGGHPVAVFRFPPRTKVKSGGTATVWASCSHAKHNPPTDFVWKEQQKWGSGPECTTILCKPNGQAVAWFTGAHRFNEIQHNSRSIQDDSHENEIVEDEPEKSLVTIEVTTGRENGVTILRREKGGKTILEPLNHPHGQNPQQRSHPSTLEQKMFEGGNDESSLCRQTRTQTKTPDPVPALYAGAARTGAASLKKSTIGPLKSKSPSGGSIRFGVHQSHFPQNPNCQVTFNPHASLTSAW